MSCLEKGIQTTTLTAVEMLSLEVSCNVAVDCHQMNEVKQQQTWHEPKGMCPLFSPQDVIPVQTQCHQ